MGNPFLQVIPYKISDSLEELDARGRVANAVAASGENHQAGWVLSGEDEFVEHLGRICEVDVIIARGMRNH